VRDWNDRSQDNVVVSGNTVNGNSAFAYGLQIGSATGQILTNVSATGNTFQGNGTGVRIRSSAAGVSLTGNRISGNSSYGVQNMDAALLSATSNWWGDASGPADTKTLPDVPNYRNPAGLGNGVTSYVDYSPLCSKDSHSDLHHLA